MHTEYEIKFSPIDRVEIRSGLTSLGAACTQEETLLRRVVFRHPLHSHGYIRVRDEESRVMTTLKEIFDDGSHIESVREIETTVGDFEAMSSLYRRIGLEEKA